jgi:hypothetical protein
MHFAYPTGAKKERPDPPSFPRRLTRADTARPAAAPAIPLHRRNTRPTVRLARRMPSRGGSRDGNVAWRGDLTNCRNSRHDHSSDRAGDEPTASPVSGTLRNPECERERARDQPRVDSSCQTSKVAALAYSMAIGAANRNCGSVAVGIAPQLFSNSSKNVGTISCSGGNYSSQDLHGDVAHGQRSIQRGAGIPGENPRE